MSKRKNTLNDLEEFLKLQASTLVAPQPIQTTKPLEQPKPVEPAKGAETFAQPVPQPTKSIEVKAIDLLEELRKLATENKTGFYDHIIKVAEESGDYLLVNTALYLKHGDNWRAGIESYWRKKRVAVTH